MHERVGALAIAIEGYDLEPLSLVTGGWTRHATAVRLEGRGHVGVGEDITYEEPDQLSFQSYGRAFDLAGSYTLDEFSRRLDSLALFRAPPTRAGNWLYRRWAFESAALDLALMQAGTNLGEFLGLSPEPLRYVVSMNLGDPPDIEALRRVREMYPDIEFKVDLSSSWTEATVSELAELGGITAVDLKGHYHGSFEGPPPNAEQYRMVAEGLPDAWIEDPWWEGPAWDALAAYHDRITWDANIHSVADIAKLPFRPECINMKPSRFGFLAELFRAYEYCQDQGIAMYGGGQFELGPGRDQIQYLASLFHPDTGNDVAPSGFNAADLADDLPTSPITPCPNALGFVRDEA
jgi:hypothetical protein